MTVYSRPNLGTPLPSWQYVVTVSRPDVELLLGQEQPFDTVPQRGELEALLINNGLLDAPPKVWPFEYALNVEFENPCDSNYLTEDLRNRAMDEQFLAHAKVDEEWGIDVEDITLTAFCIDSQGEQEQYGDSYKSTEEWLTSRWPEIQKEFERARANVTVVAAA